MNTIDDHGNQFCEYLCTLNFCLQYKLLRSSFFTVQNRDFYERIRSR